MPIKIISIKELKEELSKKKVRIAKFYAPSDENSVTKTLYIIELLDKEKYGENSLLTLFIAKNNYGRVLDSQLTTIPELVEFLLKYFISNEESSFVSNYIFPDDNENEMVNKGEKILNDLINEQSYSDDFLLTSENVIFTNSFFDNVLLEVYNKLIEVENFPVEQVVDLEFKNDDSKSYIPKFHLFYKRVICGGEDKPFIEILSKTFRFDRNPKEFTLISAIMTNKYKSEYIEFLIELYTKIRYIYYIKWIHEKCKNIIHEIEENSQIIIKK